MAYALHRDYRRMDTLDQYDPAILDNREFNNIDSETRLRVEEELNRRDAREGRIAGVFAEDEESMYNESRFVSFLSLFSGARR